MIKNCPVRHENGNCIPAGGFCTANKNICEALLNAYRIGKAQLSQEGTTSDQPVATDTNVGNKSEIPNSSDCISRQAAIDIERNATVDTNPSHFEAHQKFTQFMDDAEVSSFGRWQWANGFNTALTAVGIDLKKLPPAQPEPPWILCSERMPDTNVDILLQFKSNMGVGFYEDGDWAINTGDGIYSSIGYGEEKPIAWMPLPEPYRKEDAQDE